MPTLTGGLIGAHISRTRLPKALEIMCAEAGWTLDWQLIDTAEDPAFDFEATVDMARSDGWSGVTVTHPWKTHARAYAGDGMADDVAHLGAANTLVFGSGVTGFNTDFTGFLGAFGSTDLNVGRVVLIGAGGVAEALAPALMSLGATDLAIYDVDHAKAQSLAQTSGARALKPDDVPPAIQSADGLINATPFGMAEYPGAAIDLSLISTQTWAFDAVYTPVWTPFLSVARDAGLQTLTGFDLFRHMAIRSFAAYTGIALEPADILPKLARLEPS